MLQSLQSLFGGSTDRRSERLGFPSTASLLDQLPKDTKASRDRHAHKGGGSFKKSRPGRRPSWAPKHGGDTALMAIAELLIAGVTQENAERSQTRMKALEDLRNAYDPKRAGDDLL